MTYEGALHHAMNRGYNGNNIFNEDSNKELFLDLIKKYSDCLRIRVLAYCIMNNHYHLIFQNTSGRMSDFFKQINGQFGSLYRMKKGGKGYVFQDRYKSMIIQNDSYLLLALAYVLNNPVRAGLVNNFKEYSWSSWNLYFNDTPNEIVDNKFVEELLGNRQNLINFVNDNAGLEKLPVVTVDIGTIVGGEAFVIKALEKFNRRSGKESLENRRMDDKYFEPLEKIIMEFERKYKINYLDIDTRTHAGKRLRSELLVNLKENAGLKYQEIKKIDIFSDVSINSLGAMYKRYKERKK